jgi:hypothetical protein
VLTDDILCVNICLSKANIIKTEREINMQIVIDIPYGHYLTIKDGFLNECIKSTTEAIVKGTPLPKGHGRLIDADALNFNADYNEPLISKLDFDQALTIIEADREVEE